MTVNRALSRGLDIPQGFRLWKASDGASGAAGQKFSRMIYSVQHNASKENLHDPLWMPPPGFYLDLWGIYLATKLSPSKRKRFSLWPQLFTTQGDLLSDFPRFGVAPEVSFWHFDDERWVPDTRNGGNGMYIVWRGATVLASQETQRDLDKSSLYHTRIAVFNDAKNRNDSEFTNKDSILLSRFLAARKLTNPLSHWASRTTEDASIMMANGQLSRLQQTRAASIDKTRASMIQFQKDAGYYELKLKQSLESAENMRDVLKDLLLTQPVRRAGHIAMARATQIIDAGDQSAAESARKVIEYFGTIVRPFVESHWL